MQHKDNQAIKEIAADIVDFAEKYIPHVSMAKAGLQFIGIGTNIPNQNTDNDEDDEPANSECNNVVPSMFRQF